MTACRGGESGRNGMVMRQGARRARGASPGIARGTIRAMTMCCGGPMRPVWAMGAGGRRDRADRDDDAPGDGDDDSRAALGGVSPGEEPGGEGTGGFIARPRPGVGAPRAWRGSDARPWLPRLSDPPRALAGGGRAPLLLARPLPAAWRSNARSAAPKANSPGHGCRMVDCGFRPGPAVVGCGKCQKRPLCFCHFPQCPFLDGAGFADCYCGSGAWTS